MLVLNTELNTELKSMEDPSICPWGVEVLEDEVQSNVDCIIQRP